MKPTSPGVPSRQSDGLAGHVDALEESLGPLSATEKTLVLTHLMRRLPSSQAHFLLTALASHVERNSSPVAALNLANSPAHVATLVPQKEEDVVSSLASLTQLLPLIKGDNAGVVPSYLQALGMCVVVAQQKEGHVDTLYFHACRDALSLCLEHPAFSAPEVFEKLQSLLHQLVSCCAHLDSGGDYSPPRLPRGSMTSSVPTYLSSMSFNSSHPTSDSHESADFDDGSLSWGVREQLKSNQNKIGRNNTASPTLGDLDEPPKIMIMRESTDLSNQTDTSLGMDAYSESSSRNVTPTGSSQNLNLLGLDDYYTSKMKKWLKGLRLHKYTEYVQHMSYNDLLHATDEDLETIGVAAKGARTKMLKSIEQLRHRVDTLPTAIASLLEMEISQKRLRQYLNDLKEIMVMPSPYDPPRTKEDYSPKHPSDTSAGVNATIGTTNTIVPTTPITTEKGLTSSTLIPASNKEPDNSLSDATPCAFVVPGFDFPAKLLLALEKAFHFVKALQAASAYISLEHLESLIELLDLAVRSAIFSVPQKDSIFTLKMNTEKIMASVRTAYDHMRIRSEAMPRFRAYNVPQGWMPRMRPTPSPGPNPQIPFNPYGSMPPGSHGGPYFPQGHPNPNQGGMPGYGSQMGPQYFPNNTGPMNPMHGMGGYPTGGFNNPQQGGHMGGPGPSQTPSYPGEGYGQSSYGGLHPSNVPGPNQANLAAPGQGYPQFPPQQGARFPSPQHPNAVQNANLANWGRPMSLLPNPSLAESLRIRSTTLDPSIISNPFTYENPAHALYAPSSRGYEDLPRLGRRSSLPDPSSLPKIAEHLREERDYTNQLRHAWGADLLNSSSTLSTNSPIYESSTHFDWPSEFRSGDLIGQPRIPASSTSASSNPKPEGPSHHTFGFHSGSFRPSVHHGASHAHDVDSTLSPDANFKFDIDDSRFFDMLSMSEHTLHENPIPGKRNSNMF